MKNYNDMTMWELEAENRRLMSAKEKIRQEQLKINEVMTKKAAAGDAAKKAATMSDSERAALLQVLAPEGIPSGEGFGP